MPGGGGTITTGGWLDAETTVSITATAAPGYVFSGFTGDLSGTTNPQTLAVSGPKSVTANFMVGPMDGPSDVSR